MYHITGRGKVESCEIAENFCIFAEEAHFLEQAEAEAKASQVPAMRWFEYAPKTSYNRDARANQDKMLETWGSLGYMRPTEASLQTRLIADTALKRVNSYYKGSAGEPLWPYETLHSAAVKLKGNWQEHGLRFDFADGHLYVVSEISKVYNPKYFGVPHVFDLRSTSIIKAVDCGKDLDVAIAVMNATAEESYELRPDLIAKPTKANENSCPVITAAAKDAIILTLHTALHSAREWNAMHIKTVGVGTASSLQQAGYMHS